MWHHELALYGDGSRNELAAYPVKYQVGSGRVARSYFVEDDGFLVQSPVTWFTKQQRWDMSPGYDIAHQDSFSRVIRPGCLYCHTGQLESPEQNGFRPKIVELTISCERCHGPGELHVQRHAEDAEEPTESDLTIVHPDRISRELAEAICAQCHLHGDVQVAVRGRRPEEYRPGLPLNDYRLEFRTAAADTEFKIAGQVEQLHASRCYQESQKLTCTTCHNPHEELSPSAQLVRFRKLCIDCHEQQVCRVQIEARSASNGDNCIACHMPQANTEVSHVAFTNHRIGIHTETDRKEVSWPTSRAGLVALEPLAHLSELDRDRAYGLALLKLVRIAGREPEQLPRLISAAGMLRRAYNGGTRDPETLIALATIARDSGKPSKGIELAEEALRSQDITSVDRLEALDVLAELQFRSGRLDAAAECLREINEGHRSPLHSYLLGQIENRLHNRDAAVTALRQAVRLDPGNVEYRRALISLLRQAGLEAEAARHERVAELLVAPARPSK